ncbi:MFS transporter [Actinomadura rupiterrae]|uniref:MFS transporter n=1 Tax=Actinomadura rupiterrae TaxID=559627 RepID=UPI0020A3012D|nr:MFS transporter [Actinomadura rupiterrae]MCP2335914.1 FSR family fosmidomycin resistance protein-like MFS transporter [Actinomadura rupiterrae]
MRRSVLLLSTGHACVDVYQGAVPALVPFLISERHYSYAAASAVVLAATLLSSVVQPVFGLLTDRWRMPWLIPVSMLLGGTGIAAAGTSGDHAVVWALVALSGLGVAAYHPASARLARVVTRGDHGGMSWFSLGGNVGFAAAPLLVTPLLAAGGLGATPWLAVPAVAGALMTVLVARAPASASAASGTSAGRRDDWRMFARLSLMVTCRSVAFFGVSTLLAVVAKQRMHGGSSVGAAALFLLFAGGAAGTILGGRLAGRFGRVRCTRAAYALAVPSVAGVAFLPGPLVFLGIAATAATLYVPFSLQVTLGQDYLPGRVGTAGGVTLGLAVSVGGVASPALGALADRTSPSAALVPVIAVPALAWLLARTLREPEPIETASGQPDPARDRECGEASAQAPA